MFGVHCTSERISKAQRKKFFSNILPTEFYFVQQLKYCILMKNKWKIMLLLKPLLLFISPYYIRSMFADLCWFSFSIHILSFWIRKWIEVKQKVKLQAGFNPKNVCSSRIIDTRLWGGVWKRLENWKHFQQKLPYYSRILFIRWLIIWSSPKTYGFLFAYNMYAVYHLHIKDYFVFYFSSQNMDSQNYSKISWNSALDWIVVGQSHFEEKDNSFNIKY